MKYLKLLVILLFILPAMVYANQNDVLSDKEFVSEQYPSLLIGFKNGCVYGYAINNAYMGTYELKSKNKISLSYMAYTKLDGTQEENDNEYNYFNYLKEAKKYNYDSKTGILTIDKMKFKLRK